MIRKDSIYWVIIVGLLIWIVVQTCSPPPEPVEDTTYKDSVKVLKSEKAFKAAQFDSISTMANTLAKEKDSVVAAYLREISRLRAKATTAVQNIPVRVMEENPEIAYALAAKDDVIEKQAVLIDTLKSQVEFERNVRENLVALHYDEAKINSQLQELSEQRIITLEKDLKKERRRGKLKAVLVPIVGVLGLLLGAQL